MIVFGSAVKNRDFIFDVIREKGVRGDQVIGVFYEPGLGIFRLLYRRKRGIISHIFRNRFISKSFLRIGFAMGRELCLNRHFWMTNLPFRWAPVHGP